MNESSQASASARSKLKRTIEIVVAIGLMIISGFVGAMIADFYGGVKEAIATQPYIAVVMSQRSVDFPIPSEFLVGFQEAYANGKAYIETRDGKKIDIRIIEDLGSTDEAARIAKQLVDDKNCILVIGNSNSTLTDVTLDIFLRSTDRPAYLLPIATANDILTKAKTAGHDAVLRMVPDNASQAEVIQRLVREMTKNQRVAIYGDEENSFYSLGLSRDIASRVRTSGGKVLIEEMLGPNNSIDSSLRWWAKPALPPEIIVYVGVAHHGLLLIDQLSEIKVSAPIIFTDGCMVGSLLTNVSKIRNRAFVLSPVGSEKVTDQMPTYEPIGRDAYNLATRIISSCQTYSRAGIRACMSPKNAIQMANGFAGEYRFNADGNNDAMTYKVYEITGGHLQRLKGY
ncbi:MAG: ABC transporter substrate-binding protein [Terriglobia bacterium]|jgi:hypothetical protein